jgi:hypothetical protein
MTSGRDAGNAAPETVTEMTEKEIDPRLIHEAQYSATLAYMIKKGLPLTREKWIQMNWGGDTPKPWTAEHEMEVPAVWRDHDED